MADRPRVRRRGGGATAGAEPIRVRRARRSDLSRIIAIDASVTGIRKPAYWRELFVRYGTTRGRGRQFLVAEVHGEVAGFVVGEVRDWEFGSPPCGWVFGINVVPQARLAGIGTRLLEAVCAGFRAAGVRRVRTLLARDNTLILSFFRSQGMMAAPFLALETDLDA